MFFRANDDELSPKEAYKFMVPIFGPGVVYDSSTDVMYEQLKFVKGGLVPAQLKRDVAYMLSIIDRFATESWKKPEGIVGACAFCYASRFSISLQFGPQPIPPLCKKKPR